MITLKNILVPTDFGETSDAALRYGRELARTFGSTLHVLHVVDDIAARFIELPSYPELGQAQTALEQSAIGRLASLVTDEDRRMLRAKTVVITDSAASRAIVSYGKDSNIDLIVMGTHGRGRMARLFLGAVAERVVRTAACPVLTVHHPEHEFVHPDALQVVAHA